MKNIISSAVIIMCSLTAVSQNCSEQSAIEYQQQLNREYASESESPLLPKDREKFTALDVYPVDMKYCTEAKLVRTPDEKPFTMPTSDKRMPRYRKYGELSFIINGKNLKLDVFQSLDLIKLEKYKNHLFLPFTDLTSGNGTYGGGRYMDLEIPEGDTIILDFNKAYNPYCAYNYKYSCPLVPKQNDLAVEIRAGVKEFKK